MSNFYSVSFLLVESVQDADDILKEADTKLDGVRQKIGQIAEELRGEDIHQFHRAFTPGEFPFTILVQGNNRLFHFPEHFLCHYVTQCHFGCQRIRVELQFLFT